MNSKKVIGIDPGRNTAVAICVDGKITDLITTDFWGAVDHLEIHPDATVILELPTTKHVWHNGSTSKKAIQRTGVNVGSCIREAELLRDYLHRNNRQYKTVHPQGKIDKALFKRITGWGKSTNSHTRDAGMLCFNYFR